MQTISFNKYYNNKELWDILRVWESEFPQLISLENLGKSYEQQDIPLVILTNKETGKDTEKPAFWLDANLHATELTGTMAVLYFLQRMLKDFGNKENITRILSEQTFYLAPRLNPDGAAKALSEDPLFLRSGTRPYPKREKQDGLHVQDINGDGRILQMRFPDPSGSWKISPHNPRFMERRQPNEDGGDYYRILPEGIIEGYDGHIIKMAPSTYGVDFNRNFPWAWRPEGEQPGAGDYPTSEPEVRCVVDFICNHKNIFGAITYHTFSRVILRPFSNRSDDDMVTEDLWVFEELGEIGEKITDYPCVSVFHNFKYHPREITTGTFDDWLYDYLGIFGFTIELWDLPSAAGVTKNEQKNFIDWFRKHPKEDDYQIYEFIEKEFPDGFVDWQEFDHPQLGKIELGGWDRLYTWRNPPPHLLEQEIAPQTNFVIAFAAFAPKIEWHHVEVKKCGDNLFHLTAVLENQGFLPTYVSHQASKMKIDSSISVELKSSEEDFKIISGKHISQIGGLEGRSNTRCFAYHAVSPTDNRQKLEWVIQASEGSKIEVFAKSYRAGIAKTELLLS